jgi:16S rRNA (cytosine967-C5)-methyltransferase
MRDPEDGARRLAVQVLVRIEGGAYANLALPGALARSGLPARERRLATELVYGVTRMRRACDWLVGQHLHRRPLDPVACSALRLGAYQLAFTRVPPHAAVSSSVGLVPERARGLVNAVLRRVAGSLPPAWPDLPTELSYPDWLVERMEADLGPQPAREALVAMNRPIGPVVRADGYVQDRASRWVAELVGARTGERVADLCAAPGGKATALAGSAGGEEPALVLACDLRPRRARMLARNARRLGRDHLAVVVADGRRPPVAGGALDRVLVDAPCSGLGALARRPDARWRVRPDDVGRLAELQRQLMEAAAELVRPGGVVAYSVCTLTRAETAGVDEWLSACRPDLVALDPPPEPWAPLGRGSLLLPQAAGTDGMYLLRLRSPG